MLGRIIYMNNTTAHVQVSDNIKVSTNIMNMQKH